jgi:hypothetical protein
LPGGAVDWGQAESSDAELITGNSNKQ